MPVTGKFINTTLSHVIILASIINGILFAAEPLVLQDSNKGGLTICSGDARLKFHLKHNQGCYFDSIAVDGEQVIDADNGVSSAVKVDGQWYSTCDKHITGHAVVNGNAVSLDGIRYGSENFPVEENWRLTAGEDHIEWRIQRKILNDGVVDDMACPQWVFADMPMWTGAILDNGGVAWSRLLSGKNYTYGSHAGTVLFWNVNDGRCLEITPTELDGKHIASRFTHNPDDTYSFVHTVSDAALETRVNLSRFLGETQVWKPFTAHKGTQTLTCRISAPAYTSRFDLGDFKGVDEDAVREILNTITRYGVIDSQLCGANGWRTGYICLHEQWFAQMAMAIQDENYTRNVSATYDYFRDHAVLKNGRVLARFKDNAGDAMPGTYTEQGFYEAQWGYLLDSQPDYVMVVSEQFHNTGDLNWVRGQKQTCEAALDYLLKRDSDGDGLLEMLNQSHTDGCGSDWIDIIWAAHENALVNAEMYWAMTLWAEIEDILGDHERAVRYQTAAAKLKNRFNKNIKDGGFWNSEKKWYVYWRDKDDSIHGDNLVIPVNFSAIGYGLCDDPARRAAVLSGLETAMQKEHLFSWPLCVYPFKPKEGAGSNFPFPNYENGDIFLSWAELGTRAYAAYDPEIAMKYISHIIEQYKKDGLAFQRYARISQNGLGDDILAGNGMAVVGLYRNIFGIQPQYNRLYLEPHLPAALNGTMVRYRLRGMDYTIVLNSRQYTMSANHFLISGDSAFGMNTDGDRLEYYRGKSRTSSLRVEREEPVDLSVNIADESGERLTAWSVQSEKNTRIVQTVYGLDAGVKYHVRIDSAAVEEKTADADGSLSFSLALKAGQEKHVSLLRATGMAAGGEEMGIQDLRCEYLRNPLGIDCLRPRLSWILRSDLRGQKQTAYRILVATNPEFLANDKGDLWDSGKVASDQSVLVEYSGKPLQSRQRCYWKLQVWDKEGHPTPWSPAAFWSMGLLTNDDWKGKWIGLDEKSSLEQADWIWYPEGDPGSAAPVGTRYFRRLLTLPTDQKIKAASFTGTADNEFVLWVNGRHAGNGETFSVANKINLLEYLTPGENIVAVEAKNIGDLPNPAGFIGSLEIELGDGRTVRLQTDNQWLCAKESSDDWKQLDVDQTKWNNVRVLGKYGTAPWGRVEGGKNRRLPARYLRKEFNVGEKIVRATTYICGLGFFDLYINGVRVSDGMMNPAMSDYRKAVYYLTYDVTAQLKAGKNTLGVVLGNGRFFAPRLNEPAPTVNYGYPKLLLQTEIEYQDGTMQRIVSDNSWRLTNNGPIRANNEYDGEEYDARLEMPGWNRNGFDDSAWMAAQPVDAPGGTLIAQQIEPMRMTQTIKPVGISNPKPGVFIVDMGQAFYGVMQMKVSGQAGTEVRLISAYSLQADGMLKTADNRGAKATDIYILKGDGQEIWTPRFKGQGFRRVQVEGFPGTPTVDNFEGLVIHTDVPAAGEFRCSNDLVNRIHMAMRWGMRMFMRSAPLDPDRDERQSWHGDPAKDSESEAFNFNVAPFYTKWMDDVRRCQRSDGTIPDVSMNWEWGDGVEWASVFTIIPDWFRDFYGDRRVQKQNYQAMKRWVLAMRKHQQSDGTLGATSYGDWCDASTMDGRVGDSGSTPKALVSSAYHYHNCCIMARAARRLGFSDDERLFSEMAEQLSEAFNKVFFNPATNQYQGGTQCSYVLPLAFGLVPAEHRDAVISNLVDDIMVKHKGHLSVGLIGMQWLMQTLTDIGRAEVAWTIVTQTTRPSWGYMIANDATTIWERWDSDTRDPGMNSESLLILAGNLDAWFYQTLAGINYDRQQPGFKKIIIKPSVLGDLTWVNALHDCPYGRIISNWKRDGNELTMDVTIPVNTTATVYVPGRSNSPIEIDSGSYTFRSTLK